MLWRMRPRDAVAWGRHLALTSATARVAQTIAPVIAALGSLVQQVDALFMLSAGSMIFCLLLGGGTRDGFLSDALLQLLSIPLFLVSAFRLIEVEPGRLPKSTKLALLLCLLVVLVPLLQLIPLPRSIWTALPQRQQTAEIFDLLGDGSRWMPLSVSPEATWLALLSLLPPVAVFLAVIQLPHAERRLMSLVVLGLAVVNVFLGLTQIAQGPSSPLRFFDFTNTTEAVGFFANRNHLAALLYSATLIAAAWAIDVAFKTGSLEWRTLKSSAIAQLTCSFVVLVVLVAAQPMARSRAGLILTIVALAGVFALTVPGQRSITSGITPRKLLFSAIALATVFAIQFALYRVLERFEADPLDDARIPFARNTIAAAKAYMPLGAGSGSFIPVYAMFEKPQDVIANIFANHAHNDFLEVWLETGVIGMALFVAFAAWFVLRAAKVWRRAPSRSSELDYSLARAATIAVLLLFAHSFADYPLRTDAMMAIFAFACALLVEPVGRNDNCPGVPRALRKLPAAVEPMLTPTPASAARAPPSVAPLPQHLQGRWGEDVVWPAAWAKLKDETASPDDRPSQERGPPAKK